VKCLCELDWVRVIVNQGSSCQSLRYAVNKIILSFASCRCSTV